MATNKAKFKSLYDHGESIPCSPTGEKTEWRHTAHIREDGRRELVLDREVPIYELIQVGREETEVERIVKRAMQGDYNALNAMNGVYADIADAPNSLAQAQQLIINAKNEFDNLPQEIKREFEFNPEIYVASVGSKEWFDKMGITAKLESKRAAEKEAIKNAENTAKAMENIANGAGIIINNGGVENE